MGSIEVKTAEMKTTSESIETLGAKIKEIEDRFAGIQSGFPNTGSMMEVLAKLKKELEKAGKIGISVQNYGQALSTITAKYETTEKQVSGKTEESFEKAVQAVSAKASAPNKSLSSWDQIKILAEILGMSVWETASFMVDLIQILGTAGWQALTGLFNGETFSGEAWKEWFFKYVPNHVDDKTLLAIFTIMSTFPIDDATRKEHLDHNEEGWNAYQENHKGDTYIEAQNDMNGGLILYGNHSASYNACEVIATYNALLALNDGNPPVSFPELLNTFEGAGIAAGGEFGTSPTALNLYLEANGYDTQMLSGGQLNEKKLNSMQKDYDTYILTTYNNKDNLEKMIHTVSITCENGKYVIHNAGDTKQYDSLEAAVNGYNASNGEPISVIGIKK